MDSAAQSDPVARCTPNLFDPRGPIYRWAYRLLQNHQDALDVTQNVLLRWLRCSAVVPERQLAWIRRVTINLSIDVLRRRRPSVQAESAHLMSRPAASGEDALERRERCERVLCALRDLSEQQRLVVMSKVFDDQTFQAISDDLGISVSSVKTHYLRALQHLRAQLGGKS